MPYVLKYEAMKRRFMAKLRLLTEHIYLQNKILLMYFQI